MIEVDIGLGRARGGLTTIRNTNTKLREANSSDESLPEGELAREL